MFYLLTKVSSKKDLNVTVFHFFLLTWSYWDMYSFPFVVIMNNQKHWVLKQDKCIILKFQHGSHQIKVRVAAESFLVTLWGTGEEWCLFFAYSDFWQNSVPCDCRTGSPASLLLLPKTDSQRLLRALSPGPLSPVTIPASLFPLWISPPFAAVVSPILPSSSWTLRAHAFTLNLPW